MRFTNNEIKDLILVALELNIHRGDFNSEILQKANDSMIIRLVNLLCDFLDDPDKYNNDTVIYLLVKSISQIEVSRNLDGYEKPEKKKPDLRIVK